MSSLQPSIDEEDEEETYLKRADHPKFMKVYVRRHKHKKFPKISSKLFMFWLLFKCYELEVFWSVYSLFIADVLVVGYISP